MKLNPLDVYVNWMEHCGNNPIIEIARQDDPPAWPKRTDPVWQGPRDGLHVAQEGDFVHFFYQNGQPTNGFGGAAFAGTFIHGGTFDYRGAWSSRAGCVNKEFPELLVVDCHCRHLAIHITAESLITWRKENPRPWGLSWIGRDGGEKYLMPTRNSGELKNKLLGTEKILEVVA